MAGLLASLIGMGADEAARKQELIRLKKGKTNEQKDCIDFFTTTNQGGCGCLGGGGCLGGSSSTMTMDEYISKVQEKCRMLNIRARAINRLGIDENEIVSLIDPICLYSFKFSKIDKSYPWIKLENQNAVSSRYMVTWLFFSENQVYVYSYTFDMTSDDVWEYCCEYFYQDITCFETTHEIKEKIDTSIAQGCLKSGETVTKNNYTVESFRIIVPGDYYTVSMRDAGTQMQSVQAAKALLREKKFSK
ncbi:MAG: hypothetical protein IJQ50_03000, partial [Clostridia bacterium]|nr:hypothetical protein [Clostridia bacterium]